MLDRVPIRTPRLVLEPLAAVHAQALWEASEASAAELRPWAVWATTATLQSTLDYAKDMEVQWAAGRAYEFAICEDGQAIGAIGLTVPHPRGFSAAIGYWLRSDRAGLGFATEAGRAILDFAFGPLARRRVELRAGVGNERSLRVAEKLGFQREGLLRQEADGADGPYDCYIYGLLAGDPRP